MNKVVINNDLVFLVEKDSDMFEILDILKKIGRLL